MLYKRYKDKGLEAQGIRRMEGMEGWRDGVMACMVRKGREEVGGGLGEGCIAPYSYSEHS